MSNSLLLKPKAAAWIEAGLEPVKNVLKGCWEERISWLRADSLAGLQAALVAICRPFQEDAADIAQEQADIFRRRVQEGMQLMVVAGLLVRY